MSKAELNRVELSGVEQSGGRGKGSGRDQGIFGEFGGQFVPDALKEALDYLAEAYLKAKADPEFYEELNYYLKHYVGRPSPLYHARRLSENLGGAQIYLKREDLNHTGAHKINNVIGQVLLAKRMGIKRGDCRDRGRAAWSCHSDCVCAFRYGLCRLAWERKIPGAKPECLSDGTFGQRLSR